MRDAHAAAVFIELRDRYGLEGQRLRDVPVMFKVRCRGSERHVLGVVYATVAGPLWVNHRLTRNFATLPGDDPPSVRGWAGMPDLLIDDGHDVAYRSGKIPLVCRCRASFIPREQLLKALAERPVRDILV